MITRPPGLGGGPLLAWRLDRARHATTWNTGEGAARLGGRWNSRGVHAVYSAFDAAVAILEVAVHKGFRVLDTEPHVLTALVLDDPEAIHVVTPDAVPNPHWLVPGTPSAGQQAHGTALLRQHGFIAVPSVVSRHSWNVVFAARADGVRLHHQERFALDPRLHPADSAVVL